MEMENADSLKMKSPKFKSESPEPELLGLGSGLREEKEREKAEPEAEPGDICRTAVRFARMWGVMETLGKLPPMRTAEEKESICSRYEGLVLEWAEEYEAGGNDDPVSFFERKLDAVLSGGIQT